jgi:hypothetical protein
MIIAFQNDVKIASSNQIPYNNLTIGNGVLFSGYTFKILTASSTNQLTAKTGFDLRGFEAQVIWVITGMLCLVATIGAIDILHPSGGNENKK